jgi:hypothetical protein
LSPAPWSTGLPGRSSGCPPLPPQTRTCPIKASGSSVAAGLSLRQTKQGRFPVWRITVAVPASQIHRRFVDTVCEHGVSPVVPSGRTLCPASPSLQWVPWTSVPHLPDPGCFRDHWYYDRLRLPDALLTALRLSLALRYHACFLASLVVARKRITDALDFVPPVSIRLFCMETSGSPKFPSYPFACMPCSQTPVVSSPDRPIPDRTAAFRSFDGVGFPSDVLKVIQCDHDYTYFGAQYHGLHARSTRLHTSPHGNARGFRYRLAGSALVG